MLNAFGQPTVAYAISSHNSLSYEGLLYHEIEITDELFHIGGLGADLLRIGSQLGKYILP